MRYQYRVKEQEGKWPTHRTMQADPASIFMHSLSQEESLLVLHDYWQVKHSSVEQ